MKVLLLEFTGHNVTAFDNPVLTDQDKAAYAKDINCMVPYWDKCDAIVEGEDAVKSSGNLFIPRFPGESNERFNFRVQSGKFTNIFSDIVESLAAKPFEKEIALTADDKKEPPEEIKEFAENVDGSGNNLTVFVSETFEKAIQNAINWIFVDYPEHNEQIRTRADQKKAGLRPNWQHVLGRNVREVKTKVVNGKRIIVYIRIFEPGYDTDRVREFERDDATGQIKWLLWIKDQHQKWVVEKQGVLTISVIPLVPVITGRRIGNNSWNIRPPLQNALNLQVTLFRQESQLEFTRIMAAHPMLAGSGVKPPLDENGKPLKVVIGPDTVLYSPPDGKGNSGSWGFVEPSGNTLNFMKDDNKGTKQDLRELGKQPLTAQSGNLTVITTAVAAAKTKSAVKAWGLVLKDAIENALVITAMWMNIDATTYDPDVSVYDGYDDYTDDTKGLTELDAARERGDISRYTYLTELKRRRILADDFDIATEDKLLLKEVPGDPSPDDDDDA